MVYISLFFRIVSRRACCSARASSAVRFWAPLPVRSSTIRARVAGIIFLVDMMRPVAYSRGRRALDSSVVVSDSSHSIGTRSAINKILAVGTTDSPGPRPTARPPVGPWSARKCSKAVALVCLCGASCGFQGVKAACTEQGLQNSIYIHISNKCEAHMQ